MAEHSNTAIAQLAWDAVSRSDGETLGQILAPDIVWHATGNTPWRGDHNGLDAVLDYLARVGELTDVFDARLTDVLASESRVLIVFQVKVEHTGRKMELGYLVLARIEDGRAREVWTSPLDPDALARFWAH
ncbi:MAG: nuclear transport factor 2 family protein [Myxococcota bacterium]|nr:nuclear transport factor 2 family protein [Myxococcota bacterium]